MKIRLTWKIWLLIIVVFFSILSVVGFPPAFLQKGVLVTSVDPTSPAFDQGLREGQIIISVDGKKINDVSDFIASFQDKFVSNQPVRTDIITKDSEVIFLSNESPQITVSEIPSTNLKLGLDLIGGSRALVQAKDKELSDAEATELVDITQNRLNEFGLSDIKVRQVSDLEGNNFMLVEAAGASPSDIKDLISQQGKFEAKIGNATVFVGGEKDISSVCRDSSCAYIETCGQSETGWSCNFRFSIFLNPSAAERHAEITKDIPSEATPQGRYLTQTLDLYLDDNLVDSLQISESLKGRVETRISISGGASGTTRDEAVVSAEESMHHLQTVLVTGSLPFQLEIVKLDSISPVLGKDFTRAIILAGILALLGASLVVFARYRNFKSSLALVLTSFSEIIIILGIASLISWNLDLPSIAGILATIGTGFDDQIVILDESQREKFLSLGQRLKRAFSIIMGAYFTALVAMFPLLWAGAGLLKGFAFTTIIGITAGVFITRPAFSDVVRKITKD
ncbi:MAG: PDZ domain-containing protein [Nanoarchaeota archaeon]|nr:PDZ domain-containing protein [Nanoarchaeota archaeon]MBU1501446.1 PDZ domain-containing protein [Nanoarchaeota archaeon]MBU2458964.1 PDZ domain-containing protein [Nanoarchaeota archaeon]